jgi:hypothetical protein
VPQLPIRKARVLHGDCLEVLPTLEADGFDSVVCDPPYALNFMGRAWDTSGVAFSPRTWEAVGDVLKPGGYLLAFGGTRTYHRLACAVEDAGFELRDCIMWVFLSGFPKGKGCLKPAYEPIILARKSGPRVLPLQIDACRVPTAEADMEEMRGRSGRRTPNNVLGQLGNGEAWEPTASGRWPANLIHDGSGEVLEAFAAFGEKKAGVAVNRNRAPGIPNQIYGQGRDHSGRDEGYGDTGTAARFFKCCPADGICPLCCLPSREASDTIEAWKNTLVRTATRNGWTSQATIGFIARATAIGRANEKFVHNAKSAGSLCDSCATSIAVALVGIKTSAFNSEGLQAILACIRNCESSILIRSLACFAELWGNTDTIPTTTSLSILFGSVHHAIESSTRPASGARAADANDPASVTRFHYCPKASKADRGEGNIHPCVKPLALMKYLVRLVTPPGGKVLDPFAGSGSTGKACVLEGFGFVGIEREAEYVDIACRRIAAAEAEAFRATAGGK